LSDSIELATILLTDLVGSTRLAMSVGPVRADELRDEHFDLLREAIAASGGREVKNTGDGLVVAFSSASAAVGCAVLMQQMLERRYRRAEQQLHLRIGLGAGESTVKDGDYFGMPSIEAARLCDQAPSDGIFASAAVRMLAGRAAGVEFESAGRLELKGFPEPVEAFSVCWAPIAEEGDAPGGWPLPAVMRSVPRLAYVGRDSERAQLWAAIGAARTGSRRAVLISGEPGIGKSRLAAYVANGAHGEGFAVCWGVCNEDVGAPYEPWIEVCTQIVAHAPVELLAAHVARHGGEVSRLARNLARRMPAAPPPQPSDPETERFLLFAAVAGLLTEVSAAVPICVMLDDFHWADGQSVGLLNFLVRNVEHAAVAVIVAYRDSDLGKDHPLTGVLADLRRLADVERIALHGLAGDEVAEVLASAAGHELDEDGIALAGEIAAETDGNPFFVGEVLRSLLESGRLSYDEGSERWTVDRSTAIGLPESVREVIERRVDRLGEEARDALTFAAVIGRSFDLELLTQVVDTNENRLLDQLEGAVTASLLEESTERVGRFRFVHALIKQTLYEGLGATRRARTHQRVARALEELHEAEPGEHLGELALHWRLAAVAADRPKAADYSARAGQQALDSLAPAEATRLFGDAVELLGAGDAVGRCRALIGLGEAQRLIGDTAYRETLLEASRIASAMSDPGLAARAVLENSRGLPNVLGEVDNELLAAIERALELDDHLDPARRARLLGIQALELTYDPSSVTRRRAIADDAVALARDAGDPAALGCVLRDTWLAVWSADTVPQIAEITDELLRVAGIVSDPALQWWAVHRDYIVSVVLGRFERAADALEELEKIADGLGQPALRWHAAALRTSWEQLHGHLDASEELRERTMALGHDAVPVNAAMYYAGNLGFVRVHQGRGEEVIAMLEGSVAAYSGISAWRGGLADAYCRIGWFEKAAAIVEDGARDRFDQVRCDSLRMTALALHAGAAAQAGCVAAAETLYELLEPWANQVIYTGVLGYGHARMYLGQLDYVLGRDELAVEHLEFACRFHEEHGLLLWAAESHLWLAQALTRRFDVDRTRAHAQRALELALEHGYGAIEPRAAAVLDRTAIADRADNTDR
jgi:class 3 adenylate cyclase/tetratricopeptide (TPR) repeat protein